MEKVVHVHAPAKPSAPVKQAPIVTPAPTNPPSKFQSSILNPMTPRSNKKSPMPMIVVALLVILAGIGTGYFLAGGSSAQTGGDSPKVSENMVQTENEAGVADEGEYGEPAEGNLEEGGLDGEGTHHLVRPGGETQTVYLTSTVIDLASYEGKKVQIWGQTFKGKKSGWFMDVVKLKVVQ